MIDDIKSLLKKLNPVLAKVKLARTLTGLDKALYEKLLNSYSEVKRLIIVRLDAIGDCLLFSNSMKQIKQLFPNAEITYVCYYETHDLIDNCPYIDTRIYMDRTLVNTDKFYREKVLAGLQEFKYDLLINPLYSREFQAEEIVQFVDAKVKVGVKGDHSNIDPAILNVTKNFYDYLVETDDSQNKFELYRNEEIIRLLGGEVKQESLPEIWGSISDVNFISNFLSSYNIDEYAVVFPGSKGGRNSIKYWGSENFAAIVDFIREKLYTKVLLLGGPDDEEVCTGISKLTKTSPLILQGQFSLLQVVELLKHSKFYLGSDTSIAHFSAAIGLETVIILGGGHFGRFFPYPGHKHVHSIYKEMNCYNCNWKCTKKTNECIKEIEVKTVAKVLDEISYKNVENQVVREINTSQPFNILNSKGSKPKIDLLLPPSNNHSWHLKEAWVFALRSAGLLNKAFYITGQNYNHFFEYINKSAASDFIIALGGDHHLHFLNDTPQKQELWNRYKNPKVCYSYESSCEAFYDVYKRRTEDGLKVFSHYLSADENDVNFYKNQKKKVVWFPQFADDRFFQNIVPFDKRKNIPFFKGKLWTEYVDRKIILDALVNSGSCELLEAFLTNSELADFYNKYTAAINPPGVFGGFNVRTFEALASGNVLFQYLPQNRPLNNALFKDDVHLVYFTKDDVNSLLNKINLLMNEPGAFREIVENGYREFKEHHTLEKRLSALLSWLDHGEIPSYPDYSEKAEPVNKDHQKESTPISININKLDESAVEVSTIVSTYNSEKFIQGCIDDLLNQTLYKKGKLEIVVVVSGSEENERNVVEEYQSKFSNIKLITTDNKETIYQAWNRGIKAAQGKYITNANADDRHQEDALEKMLQKFEENKDVDVIYANVYNTNTMNDTFNSQTEKTVTSWVPFDKDLILFGCFLGPQPMWEKSLHDKFGMFDETLKVIGDYEFWLRISRGAYFYHLNEILGLYFYSDDSVEHRNLSLTKEENNFIQKKYLIQFVGNLDDVKRIREKLEVVKSAKDGEQYYKKATDLLNKREAGLRIELEIKEFERMYRALSEEEKSNKIEQYIRALSNNVIYIDSEYYLALMNRLKENNGSDKNEFELHFESAVNYLNHNKFGEAYNELLLSISSFPEPGTESPDTTLYDLFILAGNTALILNDFESSKQYFEKALKTKPDSSKACFGLAELLFIEKNFESAKTMYEWAVNNDGKDEQAIQGLKKVNKILGLSDDHNSVQANGTDNTLEEAEKKLQEARKCFEQEQLEDAVSLVNEAEQMINNSSQIKEKEKLLISLNNFKGYCFIGTDNLEDARSSFEKALKLAPDSSEACAGLGETLYLSESNEQAKVMFEWAILNDSKNAFAKDGLKKVNENLGYEAEHNSLLIEEGL